MSENETIRIREELGEIKTSVASLQADMRRVVFCLLGDFDKAGGCGLLASHASHAKEIAEARQAAADHARRIAALEDARKWIIAYAAGMMAVLAAVYFILDHHVNIPKIDLSPKITQNKPMDKYMKTSLILLAPAALIAFSAFPGCSSVPANRIEIKGPAGTYTIRTPKNVIIEDFKASIPTNGTLTIEFSKWSSTNDAQVIDKSALGQAEIVRQWGVILTNAVAAGATAAGKSVVP